MIPCSICGLEVECEHRRPTIVHPAAIVDVDEYQRGYTEGLKKAAIIAREMVPGKPQYPAEAERKHICDMFAEAIESELKKGE